MGLSKVYSAELLGHVCAGNVREAAGVVPSCVNVTVFSFVMAYNNNKVGSIFGCHITSCVENQLSCFSKFPIFINICI